MKIVFIRSAEHDITNAIPRAIEASRDTFEDIHVLCWNRTQEEGLPKHEIQDGVVVWRYVWPASTRTVKGLVALAFFQAWLAYHLLRLRPHVIQALDFECIWPTTCVGFLLRAYRIYDMRDPFAYSQNFRPFIRRLIYALDWLAMGLCTAFIIPSEERRGYLGRWARGRRPVAVILNTCRDDFSDLPNTSIVPDKSWEDAARIAYIGHLTPTRAGEFLVDFVDAEGGSVVLLVAGSVRLRSLVEKIANSSFVHSFGKVSRLHALSLMRDSHAVSLLYDPGIPVNRMAAPNKLYEALCVGTPVIVARGMSIAEEVAVHGLGWVVEYGNEQDLQNLIRDATNEEFMTAMRKRCREYYLSNCDYQKQFAIYESFYETTKSTLERDLT